MVFAREMDVYKRDIFVSRIRPSHVFNSTFWDLASELLIDAIRVREGPFQQFCHIFGPFLTQMGLQ